VGRGVPSKRSGGGGDTKGITKLRLSRKRKMRGGNRGADGMGERETKNWP